MSQELKELVERHNLAKLEKEFRHYVLKFTEDVRVHLAKDKIDHLELALLWKELDNYRDRINLLEHSYGRIRLIDYIKHMNI